MSQRILMTADTLGGVWTYAIDLCRELCGDGPATATTGDTVRLVTMGGQLSPEQQAEAAAIPGLEVVATPYRLEWQDDPWADVDAAGEALLEQARDFRPTVVHLNHFAHGDLDYGAPVLVVGHSCVETWWRAVHGEAPPEDAWATYRQRVHDGIHGADVFVSPTRSMLAAFARVYGPHRLGLAIHNGRHAAGYGASRRRPFVLAAGRLWDEAKNLAALDAAAAHIEWPVRVAGEAVSPDGRAVAGRNVRPLGRLTPQAMAGEMADAAIYALPAKYEPFGLSVLEAALSGCALVLGDIPTLRELWEGAAVFVDPDDPDGIAAAINELIRRPGRLQALVDAAQERARRYTPQRMARKYSRLYAQLRGEPARHAVPASAAS